MKITKQKHPWSKTQKDKLAELYNHEAESSVLHAMLGEQNTLLKEVLDTGLKEDMFFYDFHRSLFKAIVGLYIDSKNIQISTIKEYLKKNKIYTAEQIQEKFLKEFLKITEAFSFGDQHIENSLIIREYDMRRKLLKMCQKVTKDVFDPSHDVFDLTSGLGAKSLELSDPVVGKDSDGLSVVIEKRIEDLQKKPMIGILTGIDELDEVLLGFMGSEYTILGARPGIGKTSFLVHLYIQACNQGKKALFFNLEMGEKVFADRILSYLAEVPIYNLRKHQLSDKDWETIYESTASYLKEDSRVVSRGGLSINDIIVSCRKIKARYGLDIVFIDYIQLITTPKSSYYQNREQELANISKSLKKLALDHNIHVICAAQLNREVENRAGHRPRTSDLRESGSMEQDADNILLLNRLEKFGISQDELGNPTEGQMEIIVAKQRNGECKKVSAEFDSALSKVKQSSNP